MRKMKIISMFVLVALLLPLFVGSQPVRADSPIPPSDQQATADPEEVQEAIKILEPYVTRREDGTFKLSVRNPRALGVRPEVYRNLVRGMEQINQMVRQGMLTTDKDLNVYIAEEVSEEVSSNRTALCRLPDENLSRTTLSGCPGSNYVAFYWWGIGVGLDHCATNTLQYYLTIGAGVSAIAAFLASVLPVDGPFGEYVFTVATIMIGIGAATYDWADNMYGCGSVTYYTFVGPNWVSPQHC